MRIPAMNRGHRRRLFRLLRSGASEERSGSTSPAGAAERLSVPKTVADGSCSGSNIQLAFRANLQSAFPRGRSNGTFRVQVNSLYTGRNLEVDEITLAARKGSCRRASATMRAARAANVRGHVAADQRVAAAAHIGHHPDRGAGRCLTPNTRFTIPRTRPAAVTVIAQESSGNLPIIGRSLVSPARSGDGLVRVRSCWTPRPAPRASLAPACGRCTGKYHTAR